MEICLLYPQQTDLLFRFHIVQEFNKGVYEYILASDESAGQGDGDGELVNEGQDDDRESGNGPNVNEDDTGMSLNPGTASSAPHASSEPSCLGRRGCSGGWL